MTAESATDPHNQGVWGQLVEAAGPEDALAAALVDELEEGLGLLATLPPAVTFFGGARIKPDDPYYEAAAAMGARLGELGIPPRTGAGPGIMAAVPEGYRRNVTIPPPEDREVARYEPGRGNQPLTQGFNIILPFEQAVNPAIDVSLELAHFPTRKLMLYQNSLGLVIFPGGFGTLDELLEVWRLKASGTLDYPVVLFGRAFWEPMARALRVAAKGCPSAAISDELFGMFSITDDPEEAIAFATDALHERGSSEPLERLGRRIAAEIGEGLDYLRRLTPAVTVLGGTRLTEGEKALESAERLACRLAEHGVPTRAAGPGNLSVVLARGGHAGHATLPQQAFGMRRSDARNLYGADRVHLVNDRLTHKVLLTEGSRAVVALPGGIGTLDELFTIVCQLQTRKVASRRIILMGTKFWRPLLDTVRELMLEGPRQTISPGDLDLFTLTDDPDEAARLALAPPPTP